VNTTPKPKATKKSKGELVGPPPPPPLGAELVAAGAVVEVEGASDIDDEVGILVMDTVLIVRQTAQWLNMGKE
jgi:hypothetical protein